MASVLTHQAPCRPSRNRRSSSNRSGADEIAYIQYSSGSTSDPKGVLITQKAIVANTRGILRDGLRIRPDDRAFSWLPLYHDMGLVGFCLAPMMGQVTVDYLATTSFARRPALWLKLMSENRSTICLFAVLRLRPGGAAHQWRCGDARSHRSGASPASAATWCAPTCSTSSPRRWRSAGFDATRLHAELRHGGNDAGHHLRRRGQAGPHRYDRPRSLQDGTPGGSSQAGCGARQGAQLRGVRQAAARPRGGDPRR